MSGSERAFDASAFVAQYTPRGLPRWEKVADFVRECALEYFAICPPATPQNAQAYLREIARLSDFQFGRTGLLTVRTVFTRQTVQQLEAEHENDLRRDTADAHRGERQAVATEGQATLATRASRLERIGRALNPRGGWSAQRTSRPRLVTEPYTHDELALIERDVARNVGLARTNGEAAVVLGAGAGLSGSELLVRTGDVEDRGDVLLIHAAGRTVPVLALYEARLRRLVADTPDGGLLIGGRPRHKNAASVAVRRVKLAPSTPQLDSTRLRNTWIVTHLSAGTRVPELMAASGLETLTHLGDMAAYVAALDEHARLQMLRLSGGAR